MSNANTGGAAFPTTDFTHAGQIIPGSEGMTLRDYFAAKAMPIMWDAYDKGYYGMVNSDELNIQLVVAEGAYQMSDAMLRAREAA